MKITRIYFYLVDSLILIVTLLFLIGYLTNPLVNNCATLSFFINNILFWRRRVILTI
ncbi:hypothetical protein C2G38_2127197 [Gigaspora rosea]|uniref:Uncharacterized protein n=1 Tax=Gigaspora rosea TaxID=44941 RepID=A0A397TU16_9GLOM|nr:hypothetical protein C2G38_2127197 [Gigaspora rosea]